MEGGRKGEGRAPPRRQPRSRPVRRLTPTEPSDPHPTRLRRATFSQWEKEQLMLTIVLWIRL